MLLRLALLITLVSGCWSSSSHELRRDKVYALPGSPLLVTYLDEKTTKTTSIDTSPDDDNPLWETSAFTETVRTRVAAIDERGTQTLSWAAGAMAPFYWDPRRKILWASDARDHSLVGLTAAGSVFPPGPWASFSATELPGALAVARGGRLWNLATNTEVLLPDPLALESARVDGALLRLARIEKVGESLRIHRSVVDWSAPQPLVIAEADWDSPPLAGDRLTFVLTATGRRIVEVVEVRAGQRYVAVHALAGGAPAVLPLALEGIVRITPLGDERVLVHTATDQCKRGQIVDTQTMTMTSLPDALCVRDVETLRGMTMSWFDLGHDGRAYVDASGHIVSLGGVTSIVSVNATTVAYARPVQGGVAIEQVDLRSGTSSRLALRAVAPAGIVVRDNAVFAVESDALPTMIADGPAGTEKASEIAGIGDRPERTKLWFGGNGGVTSELAGAAHLTVHIQRWMSPQWTLAGGLGLFGSKLEEDRAYDVVTGTFGGRRFLSPTYGGLYAGAELGLGGSRLKDNAMQTYSFAASAAVQAGYQGKLFDLQLSALAPNVVEPEQGVAVMLGIRIGLFGNNR